MFTSAKYLPYLFLYKCYLKNLAFNIINLLGFPILIKTTNHSGKICTECTNSLSILFKARATLRINYLSLSIYYY